MKYLKYISPAILLFFMSCTKGYLDVNTDPNNPTEMAEAKLLPNAQKALADYLGFGAGGASGFSYVLSVYTHQITMREYPDKYGTEGVNLNTAWTAIYTDAIRNCEEIIKNAEEPGNTLYSGIAKILKAYAYSQLVDVFGDIPLACLSD